MCIPIMSVWDEGKRGFMGRSCTYTPFSVTESLDERESSVGDVAPLPCSLSDRVVNVGRLFLMMSEQTGRACSPRDFYFTVKN